MSDFYTESEVNEMVKDKEDFLEYIDGTNCKVQKEGTNYFRKKDVDRYINR